MEYMVAHVLNCPRLDLYMDFDRPLSDEQLEELRANTIRRSQREPLQYILGETEFFGRKFITDKRALIPRPETEEIIEYLLKHYQKTPPKKILDIGTGTGAIGITLSLEWPNSCVTICDLSDDALSLARENGEKFEILSSDKFTIIKSNLLESIEDEYDLIVANLPYVEAEGMKSIQAEVQAEPAMALDGGLGGCVVMKELLSQIKEKNALKGMVVLEHGMGQSKELTGSARELGFDNILTLFDFSEIDRFLIAHC